MILKVFNLSEHRLRKSCAHHRIMRLPCGRLLKTSSSEPIRYSRETDCIESSSKTYTPDFTMPKADLAIEIKLGKDSKREKQLSASDRSVRPRTAP
ncbi:MAG: hypothetical protein QOH56_2700 [Pseudonocardiales bacterium]|nr:hypothetical protein [Pseudonocardiales bacterium]